MKELFKKYIDKKIKLPYHGLEIEVVVKDIKRSYGKVRYLVAPIAGSKEVWVESLE